MISIWFELTLIIMGIILFIWGGYLMIKSKETLSWIEVTGHLEDIFLDILEMPGDAFSSSKVRLKYSYTYKENSFSSNRIYFGDFLRSSYLYKTKKMMNKFKSESKLIVYCNPKKPGESVLIRGIDRSVYFLIILGVSEISFGVGLVITQIRI